MSTWRQLKRSIAKANGTLDFKKRFKARHGMNHGVNRGRSVSSHIGSHGMNRK